jgi:hypothetical protein
LEQRSTIQLKLPRQPSTQPKLCWRYIYREAELYKAAVCLYTKPLFVWRKALFASTDHRDLYDFARSGLHHLASLHRALVQQAFTFRPGVALHRNFRGKARTLYVFPWEERLVDLLLYRLLNARLDRWFSPNSYAYRVRGFGLDRCQTRIAKLLASSPAPLFIVKRDVANYFPSVHHDLLLEQLAELVDPDDYLFFLLEQRIRFEYEDQGSRVRATQGIAFGTAVACLLANVHLTPLDRRLDALPNLHYFRYADDLLFLSRCRETADLAMARWNAGLESMQLQSKAGHEQNVILSRTGITAEGFEPAMQIHHLGLQFQAEGGLRLSRDKFRKLRNIFRQAFRRKRAKLARIQDPRKRAQYLIRVAQQALAQSIRNVALIDYYLKHVTDEGQLRLLDRWLAEEILFLTFGVGHKKSSFRLLPYGVLRAWGLPSLVHRRRQIQHGQIEAPFFNWKRYQIQKSSRETAARLHPLTADPAAFSPHPEAAANSSSQEVLVRERSRLSKDLIEAVKSEDLTTLLELSPWKYAIGEVR